MKLGKRFGIVAAMEAIEDEAAAAAAPVVEEAVVDETESSDSAIIESNELATEIEDDVVAVDDAVDATDDLATIVDTVEEAGEMDETSAAIAEVAVESLYRRLGITRRKAMPVALEAFGSTSNRKKATKQALEGWKEASIAAGARIVEFLMALFEKMKTFIKGLFDVAVKVRARAESIKKATAGSNIGARKSEEKISAGGWAANIAGDNGVIGDVAAGITGLKTHLVTIMENADKVIKLNTEIGGILRTSDADSVASKITAISNQLVQPEHLLQGFGASTGAAVPNGMKALEMKGSIIGNKKLVIFVPVKAIDPASQTFTEDVKSLNAVSCTFVDGKATGDNSAVEPLTIEAINAVCDAVIDVTDNFKHAEHSVKLLGESIKAFGGDKKIAEGDNAKNAKAMAFAALRAGNKLSTTPVFILSKHSIDACKSALDYCNVSLKAYGGAAAPAAAPAAA